MAHPLTGLKVLDFSRVLAGPFAGRMLCDLGADVVKVEPPDGDITRIWGREIANIRGYYHQQNAGKRNISIDLRAEGARELVGELVKQADILIENYRPDVMPRLGLGYEDLARINPRLIMLSISGFGHNGPESKRPAYAPVVHAEAGLMARQAARGGIKPLDLPLSVADTNASLHGLVGLLSAVIMRERTGTGQHIDIAMIDATIATDDQMQYALEDSEDTGPLGNAVWDTPLGSVLISTDARHLWKLLSERHGLAINLPADVDLQTKIARRFDAMTEYFRALPDEDAFESVMRDINIAWGRVRSPNTLATEQPTVMARRSIVQVDDRAGGTRPITQSPYRFSAAESGVRGPAPHQGEHNQQVLGEWLGMAASDVTDLIDRKVLLDGKIER